MPGEDPRPEPLTPAARRTEARLDPPLRSPPLPSVPFRPPSLRHGKKWLADRSHRRWQSRRKGKRAGGSARSRGSCRGPDPPPHDPNPVPPGTTQSSPPTLGSFRRIGRLPKSRQGRKKRLSPAPVGHCPRLTLCVSASWRDAPREDAEPQTAARRRRAANGCTEDGHAGLFLGRAAVLIPCQVSREKAHTPAERNSFLALSCASLRPFSSSQLSRLRGCSGRHRSGR
jgi:hypothetical protein